MSTPIPANAARFELAELVEATSGRLRSHADGAHRVDGVLTDSRAVTEGSAFIALRGDRLDGHAYVKVAVEAGAALVVVEQGASVPARGAAVLEVDDTLRALGDIARFHRRRWASTGARRVAFITGSAGKTTTKEIAGAIVQRQHACVVTRGNLNNRIGVPSMLLTLDDSHAFAVIEGGMSVPGEIDELGRITEPDVALVLNASIAHGEGVGDVHAIAHEKAGAYRALRGAGTAVVPADDENVGRATSGLALGRVVSFGEREGADYRLAGRGSRGGVHRVVIERPTGGAGREQLDLELGLLGRAAAVDAVAAIAVTDALLGRPTPPDVLLAALAALRAPEGRGRVCRRGDDLIVIDDTYNANPASVGAALALAAEMGESAGRRVVCVLGEMRELGESSDAEHEAIGKLAADLGVKVFVGCGGAASLSAEAARGSGVDAHACPDVEHAARLVRELAGPSDIVLVKGSRSVRTERIVQALLGGGERRP